MSGGAYLLAKEGNDASAKWKIKYHKEVIESSPKTITNETEFDNYFPSVKSDGVVKDEDKAYWGFVEDKTKLAAICGGTNACGNDLTSLDPFKKRWD